MKDGETRRGKMDSEARLSLTTCALPCISRLKLKSYPSTNIELIAARCLVHVVSFDAYIYITSTKEHTFDACVNKKK